MVTIQRTSGATHVSVVDDGPGWSTTGRRGYGLVGIAERVERLGGELVTGPPADGSGFAVTVRLPASAEVAP
jgi:signal transduction histidine kinase